jgi:glycosyltransferase involved in cell wall biosynthesis
MADFEESEELINKLRTLRDSFGLAGMRIVMFCTGYPSPEKPYAGFFHSLARIYKDLVPLLVLVPTIEDKREYEYEGVKVKRYSPPQLLREILVFSPDILLIFSPSYAFWKQILASFIRARFNLPSITFFIGSDAINTHFYRPIESLKEIPKRVLAVASFLTHLRMLNLRKYLLECDERGDYIVHPSNWQKRACEKSTFYKAKNVKIIPFPVDTRIFRFQLRKGKVRKLICVRPHAGRKYAVDLVVRASRGKYETHIYGEGPLLYKHMALARKLKANVKFFPKFFTHRELAELYLQYNMGLMLSRADTQGVSACEMQATGLPVITSAIQAIPEFATGGTILIKNTEVDKVEEIIDDINERGILEELSWKAHKGIVEKCGIEKVMREHLLLFHQLLNERKL